MPARADRELNLASTQLCYEQEVRVTHKSCWTKPRTSIHDLQEHQMYRNRALLDEQSSETRKKKNRKKCSYP